MIHSRTAKTLARLRHTARETPRSLRRYVRDIRRLRREYQQACHKLVTPNLRWVVTIAKRYCRQPDQLLDLVQEGNLGLLRAVEKFDCTRGLRFSTYAIWWIRQKVTRAILDHGFSFRRTALMAQKQSRIWTATQQFLQRHCSRPSVEEMAASTLIQENEIEALQRIHIPPKSLYEPCPEDESSCLAEIIRDHRQDDPAGKIDQERLRHVVSRLLDGLDARERQVIGLRFGLANGVAWTLQRIGDLLRLSRERISQIEESALRKLRQPSRARQLAVFLGGEPPASLLRAIAALRAPTGNRLRKPLSTPLPTAWTVASNPLTQHSASVNEITR